MRQMKSNSKKLLKFYLCRRNKVLKIIEKIGGRCVEDSNPSGLNPVAQMVEHTSTNLYGIIAQWRFISFGRAGVTKDSVPVVRTHLIPQIN